jgi:tellurite resistance protein
MEEETALRELTREERLLLMRFVCSFAWADLEVKPEERELVARLIHRLELDPEEEAQVLQWLESPPSPASVDPRLVPRAHRVKFLRAVETTVAVDGEVSPEERESLILFAKLIR